MIGEICHHLDIIICQLIGNNMINYHLRGIMLMENDKTELERIVKLGILGPPEIKRAERSRYLGEYRERVLKALTKDQVEEPGIYPEILQTLKDRRASKLIIRRDIQLTRAKDYLEMARAQKVAFKRVDSPNLRGEIGLVVVSGFAVDVEKILIPDRLEKLKILGFSERMIRGAGGKLCADCWKKLATKYPEELINYRRITWLEQVLGTVCLGCADRK